MEKFLWKFVLVKSADIQCVTPRHFIVLPNVMGTTCVYVCMSVLMCVCMC